MKLMHQVACAGFALAAAMASSDATAAVLGPGQSLVPGQRLYSASQLYYATLDRDGDFAVYRSTDGAKAWSTGTAGAGAVSASMRRDGKLVLLNAEGAPIWTSPTGGRHRVFGVGAWGSAVIINARRWKPRDKRAEPIVEQMLSRRAKLDWQSPAFDSPAMQRRQAAARAATQRPSKRPPREPRDRNVR